MKRKTTTSTKRKKNLAFENFPFPNAFQPFSDVVKQPRDIARGRTKERRKEASEAGRTNSVVVSLKFPRIPAVTPRYHRTSYCDTMTISWMMHRSWNYQSYVTLFDRVARHCRTKSFVTRKIDQGDSTERTMWPEEWTTQSGNKKNRTQGRERKGSKDQGTEQKWNKGKRKEQKEGNKERKEKKSGRKKRQIFKMSWQWEVVYGIVRGRCSRYNGYDATQELPTRDCETRAMLVNYTWYRTQSPLSTLLTRPKTAPQLPTGRMDADTRLSLCVFRQLDLSTSYFFRSSRSLLTCRILRRNWRTVSDAVKYVYTFANSQKDSRMYELLYLCTLFPNA